MPNSGEIRGHETLSVFIVDAEVVRGVYQNLDVDSMVFSYAIRVPSADEL